MLFRVRCPLKTACIFVAASSSLTSALLDVESDSGVAVGACDGEFGVLLPLRVMVLAEALLSETEYTMN